MAKDDLEKCKEWVSMPEEEQAQYTCVPPPVYRKPKGCGPAKWHLYYWIEVADLAVQSAAAGVAAASLSPLSKPEIL